MTPRAGSQLITLRFGSGAGAAHVDRAAPWVERLVVGLHALGHGDRALLPDAADQLGEQVPGFGLVQAERGESLGKLPARLPGQADPHQPASLERLAVLQGDEFLHHPQRRLSLAFLGGHLAREDVRLVSGLGHVVGEVADAHFPAGRRALQALAG